MTTIVGVTLRSRHPMFLFWGPELVQIYNDGYLPADRFKPQVAVLDIGLPVMDGYELAERLRMNATLAGCRFVALTGYGQAHDHARSAQGGFQHHLVKPIDLDRRTSIIRSE